MEADAKRIIVALLLGAPFLIAALFFGTMGISFLLAYTEFSIGKPRHLSSCISSVFPRISLRDWLLGAMVDIGFRIILAPDCHRR